MIWIGGWCLMGWCEAGASPEQDLERICTLIRAGVGASAREGMPMLKVVPEENESKKHAPAAGCCSMSWHAKAHGRC